MRGTKGGEGRAVCVVGAVRIVGIAMVVSVDAKHGTEGGVVFGGDGLCVGGGEEEDFEEGLAGCECGLGWGGVGASFLFGLGGVFCGESGKFVVVVVVVVVYCRGESECFGGRHGR